MQLILYYTSSDNKEVDKKITQVATFSNVHPVEPIDVEAPSFSLGSASFEQLKNCNYAYVPELHRYYYVLPATLTNHCTLTLSLMEDYLMSHKAGIRALQAIIDKTEDTDIANLNFNDGSFINQEGKFLEVKIFPTGFADTPSNILMVAGG